METEEAAKYASTAALQSSIHERCHTLAGSAGHVPAGAAIPERQKLPLPCVGINKQNRPWAVGFWFSVCSLWWLGY